MNTPSVSSQLTSEINTQELLLLVVGAHLRAEVYDRPLASRLHLRALQWEHMAKSVKALHDEVMKPVLCTDLWYLNATELHDRPTIAIGDPGVNAATAFLANRLPTAFVIEGSLRIHIDPEYIDLQACLWGANPSATGSAIDLFAERYLDPFLRAAHDLPE